MNMPAKDHQNSSKGAISSFPQISFKGDNLNTKLSPVKFNEDNSNMKQESYRSCMRPTILT